MSVLHKAVWFIENHYCDDITLQDVASVAGVSRYHLSRIFCFSVGLPLNQYIRLRRLSRAAIALAEGEPNILDLALSVGYGSHESFTRAFKTYFGKTPDQVRSAGNTSDLPLKEAIHMQKASSVALATPMTRVLDETTRIAGLSRHYPFANVAAIPDQWQTFVPMIPTIAAISGETYGVIFNGSDEAFDYLTGVQIGNKNDVPEQVVSIDLVPRQYLVFAHADHVSSLRDTCDAIWSDWLPDSGYEVEEAPWFEKYGTSFDPMTGEGGLEVWIPVRA